MAVVVVITVGLTLLGLMYDVSESARVDTIIN